MKVRKKVRNIIGGASGGTTPATNNNNNTAYVKNELENDNDQVNDNPAEALLQPPASLTTSANGISGDASKHARSDSFRRRCMSTTALANLDGDDETKVTDTKPRNLSFSEDLQRQMERLNGTMGERTMSRCNLTFQPVLAAPFRCEVSFREHKRQFALVSICIGIVALAAPLSVIYGSSWSMNREDQQTMFALSQEKTRIMAAAGVRETTINIYEYQNVQCVNLLNNTNRTSTLLLKSITAGMEKFNIRDVRLQNDPDMLKLYKWNRRCGQKVVRWEPSVRQFMSRMAILVRVDKSALFQRYFMTYQTAKYYETYHLLTMVEKHPYHTANTQSDSDKKDRQETIKAFRERIQALRLTTEAMMEAAQVDPPPNFWEKDYLLPVQLMHDTYSDANTTPQLQYLNARMLEFETELFKTNEKNRADVSHSMSTRVAVCWTVTVCAAIVLLALVVLSYGLLQAFVMSQHAGQMVSLDAGDCTLPTASNGDIAGGGVATEPTGPGSRKSSMFFVQTNQHADNRKPSRSAMVHYAYKMSYANMGQA